MLPNTTVSGYYEQNYLTLLKRQNPFIKKYNTTNTISTLESASKQVILATGMIERPLVFANNDRPELCSHRRYDSTSKIRCNARPKPTNFHNNMMRIGTAITMRQNNINVVAIVDIRENPTVNFSDKPEMKTQSSRLAVVTTKGYTVSNQRQTMSYHQMGKH